MRVLTFTNLYPNPFQPNRATFNRQHLMRLAKTDDLRVMAPIAWTDELRARRSGKPALSAERRVTLDGIVVDHPRYYFPPKIGRRWYGRCFAKSTKAAFDHAVEEFRPDVVYTPWAYPDGWAAVRLARRFDLPVVIKCVGSDVLLLDKHPSRRGPTIDALQAADGVIAVSRHIAAKLFDFGVPRERLRVVVDGVDREKFRPGLMFEARARLGIASEAPTILFVGNLVHVKGVDVLLEASKLLVDAGDPHRIVVIGDGPLRGDLQRRTESLGVQDLVEFRGVVDHAELPDWFRAADLFVLPSRSEGIPNVLLEASACGVPWVASSVGGIPEIAELGRSRLVKSGSPADLADAIRETLKNPPPEPPSLPRSHEEMVAELREILQLTIESKRAALV